MNIAISINSKYVMPAIVMLTSLFENNKSENIRIYVLYSNLDMEDKAKIRKCVKKNKHRVLFLLIDVNLFKEVPLKNFFTKETYYRLLIQDILPKNLNRVLYLDPDIIINGSISNFYHQEFSIDAEGREPFFVVCEAKDCYNKKLLKNLDIPLNKKYFCTGVMIYNLEALHKYINLNDIFEYISYNKNKITWEDQDVLNALFYNKVKFANYRVYDFCVNISDIREKLNSWGGGKKDNIRIKIVHYAGSAKPWNFDYRGKLDKLFWKYALKAGYETEYFRYKIYNPIYRLFFNLKLLIKRYM